MNFGSCSFLNAGSFEGGRVDLDVRDGAASSNAIIHLIMPNKNEKEIQDLLAAIACGALGTGDGVKLEQVREKVPSIDRKCVSLLVLFRC